MNGEVHNDEKQSTDEPKDNNNNENRMNILTSELMDTRKERDMLLEEVQLLKQVRMFNVKPIQFYWSFFMCYFCETNNRFHLIIRSMNVIILNWVVESFIDLIL